MPSPTELSLKYFRDKDFIIAPVEKKVPHSFISQDAFGFGDLLVAKPGWGVALIQVTDMSHLAHREKKVREIPELWVWLRSNGRFILQGWAKRGPRGKKKVWTSTEREIKCPA